MQSTLFCYCLATLIVALPHSEVQCYRLSQSSARYTGPNEQNRITNATSSSKISSTSVQPSDRRPSERQEVAPVDKQDTKRSGFESSTTKYQNSQRSNVNGATANGFDEERETSTQLGKRSAGPNQNRRPSSDQASGRASDAQTSKNTERPKSGTASSSRVTGRTNNQAGSAIPSDSYTESTTILTTEKWSSTPSSRSTSTRSNSRLTTKPMTAAPYTSSTDKTVSSTEELRYSSTNTSASRADKSKANNDGVVFPASTSARTPQKTTATQRPVTFDNGNEVTMASISNSTEDLATETPKNKFIYDVPEFTCPEGQRKDPENKKCRDVL